MSFAAPLRNSLDCKLWTLKLRCRDVRGQGEGLTGDHIWSFCLCDFGAISLRFTLTNRIAMRPQTVLAETPCMSHRTLASHGSIVLPNVIVRYNAHDAAVPLTHSFARRPLRLQQDCALRQVLH